MSSFGFRFLAVGVIGAFGAVIFACGSDEGRDALSGGPGGASGSNSAGKAGADSGIFAPSSSNPTGGGTTPSGDARCSDATNAIEGCGCPTEGAEAACWTGTPSLRHLDQCKDGKAKCIKAGEFLRWGPCDGQVLPGSQGVDANCTSTCKGECVPGTFRYCDEQEYCAWGKQDCLPNGKGGGSWGPCKETPPPSGCEPIVSFPGIPPMYDEDCCKDKGFCCQVGGVNSPKSEGNCNGIVTTCN